jgi:hypothetical protein
VDFEIDPRTIEAARVGRERCAWVRSWVSSQISRWLALAPSTWVLVDPTDWFDRESPEICCSISKPRSSWTAASMRSQGR